MRDAHLASRWPQRLVPPKQLGGSALRAFGHAAAVGRQFLRQVGRADPTLAVAGHGMVDELRVRQIEPGHDGDKRLERAFAAESRVARPLLADRRHAALLVVVRREDEAVVGQREELVVHAAVERHRVAVLEIGAPAAVDQQRVAGEDAVGEVVGVALCCTLPRATGEAIREVGNARPAAR